MTSTVGSNATSLKTAEPIKPVAPVINTRGFPANRHSPLQERCRRTSWVPKRRRIAAHPSTDQLPVQD